MNIGLNKQIADFYKATRVALYRHALAYVHDTGEAEDIVHAGLEKLLEYVIEKNAMPRYPRSFVFTCNKNLAIDALRKRKARIEGKMEIGYTIDHISSETRHELLASHFSVLSEDQKETIFLKEILGYTFLEISRIKGRSLFTIASWHRRGMGKLKKVLMEGNE
ncbi:RNA polymerase sigma factor [bacterium]|nr:RNA polymerase sigma factor [bacterium]